MVAISVIIPVFNAAQHLQACISSLVNQTFSNCEFIFVNDGSVDESAKIIQKLQQTDRRIILINQENQGVSAARNTGIEKAQGTYLGFVDADDTVEIDFFEQLYTIAQRHNVDIVTSNFNTEFQGKFIKSKSVFSTDVIFNSDEIKEKIVPFFIEQDLLNTVCTKLYKLQIIKHNAIVFPIGMTNGEDGMFNIIAFHNSNKVVFTSYCGYNYRETRNSATRNSIANDYFKMALEKFYFDYETTFGITINEDQLQILKVKRLINQVISLIAIYLNNNLDFAFKYNYIKKMISNTVVQESLKKYWLEVNLNKNRYEKFILKNIAKKSFLPLYFANCYSSYKNK